MLAMMRRLRRLGDEEGASILEFALSSTVFFAMLIGTFQGLLAVYAFHFVSDAAREGSRYAMVRGSTSCVNTPNLSNCNATSDQVQTYVRSLKYPGITSSQLTVTTTWMTASISPDALTSASTTTWSSCSSGTCNAPGNIVKVVAKYAFGFSAPFVPKATLNLTSTSEMVISQ